MNKTTASRRRRRRGCCFFPLLRCVCVPFSFPSHFLSCSRWPFRIIGTITRKCARASFYDKHLVLIYSIYVYFHYGRFKDIQMDSIILLGMQPFPHYGILVVRVVRASVHIHSVVWSVVFPICYLSLALCVTFELKNSSLIFSLGYYSYSQIPFPHFLYWDQCTSAFVLQPTGSSERAQTRTHARISTINERERIPTFRIIDATH